MVPFGKFRVAVPNRALANGLGIFLRMNLGHYGGVVPPVGLHILEGGLASLSEWVAIA